MLPPPPPRSPHSIVVIRPRTTQPSGALRIVRINPLVDAQRRTDPEAVAVQGVLPLGNLTNEFPRGASHVPISASSDRRGPSGYSEAELHLVSHQICTGIIEVLYGTRAPSQLLRCTTERLYGELARRSATEKARLRTIKGPTPQIRLERIRIQRPSAKAVEICARITRDGNIRALAARIEYKDGRWVCVALEAER